MRVPFLDLRAQYSGIQQEILREVTAVLESGAYILGPKVQEFERNFAEYVGCKFVVGVANGTDALRIAFEALGVNSGDEVIIPAHTFVATAIGVLESGARPVLIDVDPETCLIDCSKLEQAITNRTKAICPVHLYGRACNMEEVGAIARRHGLAVVEDAAQSHGARRTIGKTGSLGDIGCFSFYPGKNLGAYGDAGALATSDAGLNARMQSIRNYGSTQKYFYPELGRNSRLDSVQAAILQVKLPYLEQWNRKRWTAAVRYNELLSPLREVGVGLPAVLTPEEHVFHLYVIRVKNRDRVRQHLSDHGIETGIHYPAPFYLEPAYRHLGYAPGAFPVTEKLAQQILSLPMFPEISNAQLCYTSDKLTEAVMNAS